MLVLVRFVRLLKLAAWEQSKPGISSKLWRKYGEGEVDSNWTF
jgi:hypothetical protein